MTASRIYVMRDVDGSFGVFDGDRPIGKHKHLQDANRQMQMMTGKPSPVDIVEPETPSITVQSDEELVDLLRTFPISQLDAWITAFLSDNDLMVPTLLWQVREEKKQELSKRYLRQLVEDAK